jgi:hypothetical protein
MNMQISFGIASFTFYDDRMVIIIDKEKPVILTKPEVVSASTALNYEPPWKCRELEIRPAPYGATVSINDPAGGRVCQGIETKEVMALMWAFISHYGVNP